MQPNRSFFVLMLLLVMAGCAKSLRTLDDVSFTTLEIRAHVHDAMGLKVTADDSILVKFFETPTINAAGVDFRYTKLVHRFRVYDVFTNQLKLDTLIALKARNKNVLTFFQPAPAGKLEWIGPPPVSEPLPHKDSAKMSIIYTLPDFPDVVKVVVENSVGNTTVYKATDSFTIERGKFSRYFSCKNSYTGRLQLKLYTANAQRTPVATVLREEFIGLSSDFYVYGFRTTSGNGTVPTLKGDRFY
jgi:hypothetical protein